MANPDKIEYHDTLLQELPDENSASGKDQNEKFQASVALYQKMVEEVQEYAIILLDENGIILNWNKGAERIKQYKESEIVGKSFYTFYLPEDRESDLPRILLEEARRNGKVVHEGWRMRKDQTRFWGSVTLTALHDENNHVVGFTKVTRDLTEKKIADDELKRITGELKEKNEALRKSEERYHQMIAEVEDYAIILLDEKGNIQNWNVGAEKIKGYSPEEIIGKNFSIFYSPDDRAKSLPDHLLQEAVVEGKAIHEGWRIRKDGSKFWGSIVITALHDPTGKLIGFSKVTRDLTERKNSEDNLRAYLESLESKNKELEQFAYVASHDLQEPLRKIQSFYHVILSNINNEQILTTYLAKINSSARRMSELINAILNYSRLSKVSEGRTGTDLNMILDSVKADFDLLIREKEAVITSDKLPVIKAVPVLISQLFGNLVGNALKFSKGKPVIKVTAALISSDSISKKPDNIKDSTLLKLAFADNGIGFEQQYEELIFSMFQRLHGKHEFSGTGIGLALCRKIVEAHGGFMTAQGELSKGAIFYVYLPADDII